MAGADRGARAPRLGRASARRGAHRLHRLVGGAAGRRPGQRGRPGLGGGCTCDCTTGRGSCAPAASPRSSRRSPPARTCPRACSPAPTASGGSPTCATSASCCTPRPPPSSSAPRRSRRGCARRTPSEESGEEERAGDWTPTRRRCRCSRSTAPRDSSSRSSTSPSCGRSAADPDERQPVLFHDPRGRRRCDARRLAAGRRPRRPCPPAAAGGARRGAAARLCRAHPGAAPGDRLVGRVVRQPLLAAGTAAVRARGHGRRRAQATRTPDELTALQRFGELARTAPDAIAVERAAADPRARFSRRPAARRSSRSRAFERSLDLRWRRTSYTDITAASHEAYVGYRARGAAGRATSPTPRSRRPAQRDAAAPELSLPALLGEMPVGAEVGTFVHSVMEATDFDAADLRGELAGGSARCARAARSRSAIRRSWPRAFRR